MKFVWLGFLTALGLAPLQTAQTQQPAAQPPQPAFQARTVYVELDARVTDKRHQFVSDLTAADVQLLDDGKAATMATFLKIETPRGQWPSGTHPNAGPSAATEAPGAAGRVYVLLMDDLHVHPSRARNAVRVARQFIDNKLAANDQMAVMYTSQPAERRQPFTNNRDLLRNAVDRFSGRGLPPAAVTGSQSDEERVHVAVAAMATLQNVAAALANVQKRRKTLLLVSEGIDFDYTKLQEHPNALNVIEATQEAVAAAVKSNVSIYAIDPRGLTQSGDDGIQVRSLPHNAMAANGILSNRREDLRRSQDNLRALADQTDGFAVVNSNEFAKAFDRIVDESSSYYLIGYEAPSERQDGKQHRLDIRVNRRDVDVHGSRVYVLPAPK
jgi:VWFA-related protein